jgi:chorismate synthase
VFSVICGSPAGFRPSSQKEERNKERKKERKFVTRRKEKSEYHIQVGVFPAAGITNILEE